MDPSVRHLMQTDVKSVQLDDHLSEVSALLDSHAFHHVPVLDGEQLVGILSVVDLARMSLQAYLQDEDTATAHLDTFSIADVMTSAPETLTPDQHLSDAADALAEGAFHALPVVEGGRLVGILTSTDLLRWMATQR